MCGSSCPRPVWLSAGKCLNDVGTYFLVTNNCHREPFVLRYRPSPRTDKLGEGVKVNLWGQLPQTPVAKCLNDIGVAGIYLIDSCNREPSVLQYSLYMDRREQFPAVDRHN